MLITNNIVPINAIVDPIIFFVSDDSFSIINASIIVNIGPDVCIILLTDAVVYAIPVFCNIPGNIIVNVPTPMYIIQSFFDFGIKFFLFFIIRYIIIGMNTSALIAASIIGGTPLFNAVFIKGNEIDQIKIALKTVRR